MFGSLTSVKIEYRIVAGVGTLLMSMALVPWTGLSGQSAKLQSEEWDAVESGLVDLLARGDEALRKYPAVQIVSPPISLDRSNPEGVQRALVQLADVIPEWSPYFRPSGRRVRLEFSAFVDALQNPVSWPGGTQPAIPSDDTAYRFNPDIAELARRGTPIPAGTIKWEVQSGSGSAGTTKSSKRIRIRIGSLVGRGSSSVRSDDVDAFQADGSFSADGMLVLNVMAGPWFSARAIDRFGKGPFKTAGDPSRWWGPNGRFALYPRSLIVARQPSFSLKLDARSYQRVKMAVVAGASITVGPFRLSKTVSGSAELKFDDGLKSITAKQANDDVVIAVMNHVNDLP